MLLEWHMDYLILPNRHCIPWCLPYNRISSGAEGYGYNDKYLKADVGYSGSNSILAITDLLIPAISAAWIFSKNRL